MKKKLLDIGSGIASFLTGVVLFFGALGVFLAPGRYLASRFQAEASPEAYGLTYESVVLAMLFWCFLFIACVFCRFMYLVGAEVKEAVIDHWTNYRKRSQRANRR